MLTRKRKGLFVGLCTLDYVYYADEFPRENKKIKVNEYARYIGGPAANAAITYAALGGDATLATCIGSSLESKMILEELRSYGVKVLNYSSQYTLPNTASILISKNGQRTIISGQHTFLCDKRYPLDEFDFALFDCNQQEISLDILKQFPKKPVILDAGSWKPNIELFLQRADIVIASEDFADVDGRTIFELKDCNAIHKVITRGERSILYENEEIEVPQVDAVDTLGAGDIFHGAFCFAYFEHRKNDAYSPTVPNVPCGGEDCLFCEQQTFKEALQFAANIASESVRYKGTREWMKHYILNAERFFL